MAELAAEGQSNREIAQALFPVFGPSPGASGFVFPLPTSAASPPSNWCLDDGVDVAAPGHTPLYAVGPGTIVLHGLVGFGPWAPVLRLDDGHRAVHFSTGVGGPLFDRP